MRNFLTSGDDVERASSEDEFQDVLGWIFEVIEYW